MRRPSEINCTGLPISGAISAPWPQVCTCNAPIQLPIAYISKCKINHSFLHYLVFAPHLHAEVVHLLLQIQSALPVDQLVFSPSQSKMAFVPTTSFTGLRVRAAAPRVCHAPVRVAKWRMSEEGKGFGGGEATRDPTPTEIDPNDPKGKQKAIHHAETFADYQARVAREKAEKEAK
ncbi:unnamed protein product [Chondrus crispus]|uniref:Uncharacterized protein n=1 Tax=Chondrus crispus TaxID=2769 RepID=R7QAR9_CHOCR|nr:unnamed protein product [Chondrus crispus]CDF35169.1 unnamed protein product [Chondrus crispus]|eukprot:XP_005714988.1 unnamed protein product [Chondrus crispus]